MKSNGSDAVSCIRIWDTVRTVYPLSNDLLGLNRLILDLNWTFLPFAAESHLSSFGTNPLKTPDEPTTINFLRLSEIDNKRTKDLEPSRRSELRKWFVRSALFT
jgi:hypothetical protein